MKLFEHSRLIMVIFIKSAHVNLDIFENKSGQISYKSLRVHRKL